MSLALGSGGAYDDIVPPRPGQTVTSPYTPAGDLTVGSTPNFQNLILSDPEYLGAQASASTAIGTAAARRKAALQALVTNYGGLGSLKDQYGDLDPGTLDLAGRNQFSTTANIARNYTMGVGAAKRALAARGMLHSSDLGAAMSQADLGRASQEYDAGRQFSNDFQGTLNDYLTSVNGANAALPGVLGSVAGRLQNSPGAQGSARQAHLVPNWQSQYGQPIYQDDSGQLYMVGPNGQPLPYSQSGAAPVTAAAAPAPAPAPTPALPTFDPATSSTALPTFDPSQTKLPTFNAGTPALPAFDPNQTTLPKYGTTSATTVQRLLRAIEGQG